MVRFVESLVASCSHTEFRDGLSILTWIWEQNPELHTLLLPEVLQLLSRGFVVTELFSPSPGVRGGTAQTAHLQRSSKPQAGTGAIACIWLRNFLSNLPPSPPAAKHGLELQSRKYQEEIHEAATYQRHQVLLSCDHPS